MLLSSISQINPKASSLLLDSRKSPRIYLPCFNRGKLPLCTAKVFKSGQAHTHLQEEHYETAKQANQYTRNRKR